MDFLWHEVSEKEKAEIKKQAKEIIDSFSKKLSKIDREMPEPLIERDRGEREEGEGRCDEGFSREIMFENAPQKNKYFIIAEGKEW